MLKALDRGYQKATVGCLLVDGDVVRGLAACGAIGLVLFSPHYGNDAHY